MRISMILDEKKYIEQIIHRGKTKKDNLTDVLKILGMYYAQECGYTDEQIKTEFNNFYVRTYGHEPNTDMLKMFDRYIKRSKQRNLLKVNFIPIYKSEMETIQGLDNKITQRLLFTMMCLAKYNNYLRGTDYNYTNNDMYEMAKLAAIPGSKDEKLKHYVNLIDLGLIYFSKKACNTRVDCMTDNFDQEIAIKITRIEDIANQYRLYCGEDYVYCEDCGLLFRNSSTKPAKKCPTCRKYDPAELRTFICADCGEEFLSNCRGNIPVRCHTCRVEYKKLKYKPVESKTIVCEECGKKFTSDYRGNAPTKCPECMKYKSVDSKTIVCEDCGKEFEGVYRRDIPTKCPECREYKPVGEKILICIDCGKEFKGKRGLRCKECKLEENRRIKREYAQKTRNKMM